MLGLKMPWTRHREREAAALREQLAAQGRLEGRRVIAREIAAQVRADKGVKVVRAKGGAGA